MYGIRIPRLVSFLPIPVSIAVVFGIGLAAGSASAQGAVARAAEIGDEIRSYRRDSEEDIDYTVAEAVIDHPFEMVMGAVTDYPFYHRWMPDFDVSRELSRRGNNAIVYLQASIANDTVDRWVQIRVYERRPQGETRIIEARKTDGDVNSFYARWEVTPLDDGARTYVKLTLLLDPDLPLPDGLVNRTMLANTNRAMTWFRYQCDTHYANLAD